MTSARCVTKTPHPISSGLQFVQRCDEAVVMLGMSDAKCHCYSCCEKGDSQQIDPREPGRDIKDRESYNYPTRGFVSNFVAYDWKIPVPERPIS